MDGDYARRSGHSELKPFKHTSGDVMEKKSALGQIADAIDAEVERLRAIAAGELDARNDEIAASSARLGAIHQRIVALGSGADESDVINPDPVELPIELPNG